MNFNQYQKLAMSTANTVDLVNAALGLSGESGEVADVIKKYKFQGHLLDKDKIIDELGDVLWYIALMAQAIDISLLEVADKNIKKLAERYPEGFSADRSTNRSVTHD